MVSKRDGEGEKLTGFLRVAETNTIKAQWHGTTQLTQSLKLVIKQQAQTDSAVRFLYNNQVTLSTTIKFNFTLLSVLSMPRQKPLGNHVAIRVCEVRPVCLAEFPRTQTMTGSSP